ncbi:uncharacterized protein LOC104455426 [Eucalyptus grandis]|uniref:uncharacterized protein LOC104455426 n=1 Tax=Eucalyptus grandis TaxID=71139 RepID=UPI00192E888B|nr:uncharacterized protein LOC104455426 [Eucalyptus grandis]
MADSVAIFGIGLICQRSNSCSCVVEVDEAIRALWASFLLLHLGGPDTITAFSLEDSLLWRRHTLSLIFQGGVAIYVFVQIFSNNKSLATPTILVFLIAIIKNVERLVALNLSSLPKMKQSMLSQQRSSHGEDRTLLREINFPNDGSSNEGEPKLDESIVVKHAFYFFQIFKIFIGDLIFSREERQMSRQYFQNVSAMDALRVISVELQFIYEVLHTKALAIRSTLSYFFRFIAFTHIVIAFILFIRLERHRLHALDVKITYSLFLGGIALDVIALFMLIFSDWTVAEIKGYNRGSSQRDSFLNKLISAMDHLRKPRFTTCEEPKANATYEVLNTLLIFQRWSESISACNLFSEFSKESPRKMYKRDCCQGITCICNICCFPILMVKGIISCLHQAGGTMAGGGGQGAFRFDRAQMIANTKYVSKNPFINKLWIFMFEEVRRKSIEANDETQVKNVFDARGDMFLQSIMEEIDCSELLVHVTDTKFDFSILAWHIATEMWYIMDEENMGSIARNDEREFSKILSDYMVYLLLNQSDVVSAVGDVAQMTSAEILFEIWVQTFGFTMSVEDLCNKLYKVSPSTLNSTSTLGEGIKLAQEMARLGDMKWKVMSGVWVEMLSYAASHIKGNAHVLVLSKGGELLAFVWLLMAHFGCFYSSEWGIYRE